VPNTPVVPAHPVDTDRFARLSGVITAQRMKGRTNRMIPHLFDQLLGAVSSFFGLLLIP
jgi:hypothetical protein